MEEADEGGEQEGGASGDDREIATEM
jgi:hypothetical protein